MLKRIIARTRLRKLVTFPSVSICTVMCVRNEAAYLKHLLPLLASQDIDVYLIDNDSEDESHALYSRYAGKPLVEVKHLPFNGVWELQPVLDLKSQIIAATSYDWYVNHDADEILEHRNGRNLRYAIEEAEWLGYNVLNFDEFVFLPEQGENYSDKDYTEMNKYYFFDPFKNRRNKAFKKSEGLVPLAEAGTHTLEGENLKVNPQNHILRHYITLSQEHIIDKYTQRKHPKSALAKGWHSNRDNLTADILELPKEDEVIYDLRKSGFVRKRPVKKHYWEWGA